ncbi:hypothetical protein M409DRAFT_70548 [Zasmidium cellare ATCC 36951]|uniref:MHYT domain-containing protein n=1 Tax=Zasmidium cellare ATCC 36951 TaxID=1080233 RepID=A0A6A6C4U6_ZASCE|nr:uncharacterized protein M409DRAFT_70548 [Zasmidium cellare ATCC 36951]KAF2160406.1 hypothetical protein M409DRAFT_70548 [Zasmidium cellare ATCC 36951]
MGLVGIWCMHFIGNRAIVLDKNQPEIQLVYHSGFTVLSLVLPVSGLIIAFSVAEGTTKKPWLHHLTQIFTGVFAGLSIVGMHYVANFGVSNYILKYSTRYLVASFVIAVGDCLTVLVLFYSLREKWISSWWKRVLCAMSLAGGVSAMHFTASTNCTYTLRHFNSVADITSRNSQVIIAGVMCGTAAFFVFGFLIYTQWRSHMFKNRSQQITVACAIFDPAGRVLVTTEGVLPSRKITHKYNHRTFDDEFDDSHPVFQWVFRVTHNWQGVGDLIPKMKSHLSAHKGTSMIMVDSRPSSSQSSAMYDEETYSNYAILFEERFCTAAASMASTMNWPIEKLGVLYDRIVETGVLSKDDKASKRNTLTDHRYSAATDNEASKTSLFGKGQVMFITREVDQAESNGLLNSGYKFASIQHVGRTISHAMQIPLSTLEAHISDLKRYVENLQSVEKQGTYLAFFALIPKPHHKGFDVAVKKDHLDQLPDAKILDGPPQPWQTAILNQLDGKNVAWILDTLTDRTGRSTIPTSSSQEWVFVSTLHSAITTLIQPFPEQWINHARFWSKQLVAHYAFENSTPTYLYSFTVIGDMHAQIDHSDVIVRTPKTFFEARHRCYTGSPDHAILARDIHQTFGPLFAKRQPKANRMAKLSVTLTNNPLKKVKTSKTAMTNGNGSSRGNSTEHTDDNSSVYELVDKSKYSSGSPSGSERSRTGATNNWGGILVNSETVVQSDNRSGFLNGGNPSSMPMGMNVAVSTAEPEVTFANELFNFTKAHFTPGTKNGL